jgi:hypothetical protein
MRSACHQVKDKDKQDEGIIMTKGTSFYQGMTTELMRIACSGRTLKVVSGLTYGYALFSHAHAPFPFG